MNAQTFMEEFYSETEPNPFSKYERVWELRVSLWIEPYYSSANRIHLRVIRSLDRRRGNGSAGLEWLNNLADKHQVVVFGWVQPVGVTKPKLTAVQLRSWYRRHGYTVDRESRLIRVPKTYGLPNSYCLGTIATSTLTQTNERKA